MEHKSSSPQVRRRGQGAWNLPLDQAAQELRSAFNAFDLTVVRGRDPRVTMQYGRFGAITLGDVVHNAELRVEAVESRRGYHLMLPVSGLLEYRHQGVDLAATPETGALYGPDSDTVLTRWAAHSRILNVRFDQTAVQRALSSLLGEQVVPDIPFTPTIDYRRDRAQSWTRMLRMLGHQLGCADSVVTDPLVALPLTESLLHGLLLVADHPYRQSLARRPGACRPAAVRCAIDLIEADPAHPLTTSALASQVHVSVRTLQEGFRRYIGTSPMGYLRKVRLRRAHHDLRTVDPSVTTVASIAHRWGFTHLGRFSAVYQREFGELPTQTLRRTT